MPAILRGTHPASTSVETLPGTIFRISHPNRTHSLSKASSTCFFKSLCSKKIRIRFKKNDHDHDVLSCYLLQCNTTKTG